MSTRTAMRDRLEIGQVWRRRRDKADFRVRQVWRTDRRVRMAPVEVPPAGSSSLAKNSGDFQQVTVSFSDLRRLWEMVES